MPPSWQKLTWKKILQKFDANMKKKHDILHPRVQISTQWQIECSRHNFEDIVKVDTDLES